MFWGFDINKSTTCELLRHGPLGRMASCILAIRGGESSNPKINFFDSTFFPSLLPLVLTPLLLAHHFGSPKKS
jgi:hypothetical protein